MRKAFLAAATLPLLLAQAAWAHPGTGIVVDRQGRVFFTDLKRIWQWAPGGGLTAVVSGKHSHAIRLDAAGNLEGEQLTYDSANARWWTSAWRLAPDGTVSDTAAPAEGFPDLFTPAVAPDGTRYYARVDNNRRDVSEIHRQKPDGSRDVLAGGIYGYADGVGREARFGPIGAIAVGPGGDLYVTDEVSVRKVTTGGRVTTLARGGPLLKPSFLSRFFSGRFGKMMGLAVDARGEVFAANYGGGRVVSLARGESHSRPRVSQPLVSPASRFPGPTSTFSSPGRCRAAGTPSGCAARVPTGPGGRLPSSAAASRRNFPAPGAGAVQLTLWQCISFFVRARRAGIGGAGELSA
jgi:hypothetical protein